MFFKVEGCNFQHLFERQLLETSQNFNSFSLFRQFVLPFFLSVVWLSWNLVRFHKILYQTDAENISFLSTKTQNVSLLKRRDKPRVNRLQYQTKKGWSTVLIFSDGFGVGLIFQKHHLGSYFLLFLSNSTCPGMNSYLKRPPKNIDCKVQVFWKGHKFEKKISNLFCYWVSIKKGWRFLCPCHNILPLNHNL